MIKEVNKNKAFIEDNKEYLELLQRKMRNLCDNEIIRKRTAIRIDPTTAHGKSLLKAKYG